MSDAPESPAAGDPLVTRFKTRIHRLAVAGRTIDLLAPVDPDALLDDPEVEKRYQADNYMPYWPIVWPSGLMLAGKILREGGPAAGNAGGQPRRCIDLGCGLGMTGIAAGLLGWHVTFTDYDQEAVEFAAHNARRNGVREELIRAVEMDWRAPLAERFEWVLASDVLYERRLHPLLLGAVSQLLQAEGVAWVSDPERTSAEDFPVAAVAAGFRVETVNMEGDSFGGGRQTGQCYVLRKGVRV